MTPQDSFPKIRVALIDDDTEFVSFFLRLWGTSADVISCSGLEDALGRRDQLVSCDVIVADVHLKDGAGFGLLERLRKDSSHIPPFLFVTEDLSEETRILGLRMGVCDVLLKSMNEKELILRIRNAVINSKSFRYFRSGNMTVCLEKFQCDFESSAPKVLTKVELMILVNVLASEKPMVRQDLEDLLWPDVSTVANTLNAHLSNLNKKLASWSHRIKLSRSGIVQLHPRDTV